MEPMYIYASPTQVKQELQAREEIKAAAMELSKAFIIDERDKHNAPTADTCQRCTANL